MKTPPKSQIVLRIAAIIAAVEFVIMIVFMNIPFDTGTYVEVVLDVVLLVLLSAPIIYVWIVKPYVVAHDSVVSHIKHMANHDALTELPNRRLLSEHLNKMTSRLVREKVYGAILLIDLDGFKLINDNHGHDAGDAVLMETAKRLIFFARTEDIVSRVGGDEFVVALGHLGSDESTADADALLISERIQKEITKDINYNGIELKIGASIGLRILRPEAVDIELALKDADSDMYKVKKSQKSNALVARLSETIDDSH